MPHYFFHRSDGAERHTDREGLKLPDAEAAFYEAWRCARGRPEAIMTVEVVDEKGMAVWTLPAEEVAAHAA